MRAARRRRWSSENGAPRAVSYSPMNARISAFVGKCSPTGRNQSTQKVTAAVATAKSSGSTHTLSQS